MPISHSRIPVPSPPISSLAREAAIIVHENLPTWRGKVLGGAGRGRDRGRERERGCPGSRERRGNVREVAIGRQRERERNTGQRDV